jgi:hypothetical protein
MNLSERIPALVDLLDVSADLVASAGRIARFAVLDFAAALVRCAAGDGAVLVTDLGASLRLLARSRTTGWRQCYDGRNQNASGTLQNVLTIHFAVSELSIEVRGTGEGGWIRAAETGLVQEPRASSYSNSSNRCAQKVR